jgi:hypothetical protein
MNDVHEIHLCRVWYSLPFKDAIIQRLSRSVLGQGLFPATIPPRMSKYCFLRQNLCIDWRSGRWYECHPVDYDLFSSWGNWWFPTSLCVPWLASCMTLGSLVRVRAIGSCNLPLRSRCPDNPLLRLRPGNHFLLPDVTLSMRRPSHFR